MKSKIIFLVGPTAVGKTAIAVKLAGKISAMLCGGCAKNFGGNAEIISCDSMQIYRGMDIITSKPSAALRKKTAHHLIDINSPEKEYNVARYYKEAGKKIKAIIKRGGFPLFVGGTGLYVSTLVNGIFKDKAQNKNIRSRLYQEAEKHGSPYLYKKLKKVDPHAALKIHPNDTRRIVRALEVFETTGKPISQLQKQRRGLADEYDVKIFCLNMPRDRLYQRIDERVDKMFKYGLVKEVKKLLKLKLSKTASFAIGIKELKGYFTGAYDLEEAKRMIKQNTRNYAKRQLTWFRKDKRIKWIEVNASESPEEAAKKIWNELY